MASINIAGNTSGTITVSAPAVAGSNTVTLPALTGTVSLDVGSWSVVTGSRAIGTTYTNSSGKTMYVSFKGTNNLQNGSATFNVAGVTIGGSSNAASVNAGIAGFFIVPNGATYSITNAAGTTTITTWAELT